MNLLLFYAGALLLLASTMAQKQPAIPVAQVVEEHDNPDNGVTNLLTEVQRQWFAMERERVQAEKQVELAKIQLERYQMRVKAYMDTGLSAIDAANKVDAEEAAKSAEEMKVLLGLVAGVGVIVFVVSKL